ncbi:putative glycoside hydrolase [Aquibacillus koreensis]|uniref:Glycoside hydrolase n=1 Tax=Aquibacillus koreensis TaxID=279446 RepID=A0A9X3WLY8_9BACI|nr:putative glycoside hydrolase [Aquibacillus koreensis]MCT2534670.1 putative glycoside hydrolase [Aquibacillus koreensis]MDC3419719.1 putative glycoside hydrolase [Aquibacillus koreensis]
MTAHSAGGSRLDPLMDMINTTDLNTMVIDVKEDYGNITYKMEEYDEFSEPFIKDPENLMEKLNDSNIYPIARLVVFKDTVLAENQPNLSYLTSDGQVWKNGRGEAFVNPFLPEVWEYNVEVAKSAAKLGFKEIQFDYVRFPEGFENKDDILQYDLGDYKDRKPSKLTQLEKEHKEEMKQFEATKTTLEAAYNNALNEYTVLTENQADGESDNESNEKETSEMKEAEKALDEAKEKLDEHSNNIPEKPVLTEKEKMVQLRVDAVTDFVEYAKKELDPLGVNVSVDIFGYTATIPEAPGIGQNFLKISEHVDVISSMIYPSHWGPGYFNIPQPDTEPYRLVKEYIKAEKEKLAQLEKPPISRPWIQDFTASWLGSGNYISYGKKQVEDQIRALHEQGVEEFLLWNASNKYSEGVDYTPLK